MNKYIKLLFLGIIFVGAIIGIIFVVAPGNEIKETPDFSSETANEWKEIINDMCQDNNWSEKKYIEIEQGIHTDRVTSNGSLISSDEDIALQNYLFSSSCQYLWDEANSLFAKKSYPEGEIKNVEDMKTFLGSQLEDHTPNSNWQQSSNIISEYHQLMNYITYSSHATYSHPLKAFSAISADAAKSKIRSLKYYGSHFSKNTKIMEQVNNLEANRNRAEREYYANLEKAIENHYNHSYNSSMLSAAMQDEIDFESICPNQSLVDKLENFVRNLSRR